MTPRMRARLRRERLIHDTRLRWNDPDLPCYDSRGRKISPDTARNYAQLRMNYSVAEHWTNDPTYELKTPR